MDTRQLALKKNKAVAGALLVGAALLFIVARFNHGTGPWAWVAAFAEAAMVGALADWFAVVALFRHPLGLPIPHTAIVAEKKESIADNMGRFIQEKFLATEVLVERMREFDPARHLCNYLLDRDNAAGLARGITRVISESIDFLEDERVSKVVSAALGDRIDRFDAATSAANLFDSLRKDSRHQVVLDELLKRLGGWLATPESQEKVAVALDNWVDAEYPLLSKFIPNRPQFSRNAGEKIVKKVSGFLDAVNADPTHELRHEFDRAVSDFIVRLRHDEGMREKVAELKRELVDNQQLSHYAKGLVSDLKNWMVQDLDREHSSIQKKIADAAVALGNTLSQCGELGDSINEHLEGVVRKYAGDLRSGLARHISGTVKEWENEEFINEIELSIGSDLQFIRMNGTLVGGMIGILLHAASLVIG
ncbi:DUF445 domain-containing protein [Geomonas subterranea]|uniref:DUF445 domain-containing protein n=1 Tax=Geomonas subterranea TaxID=2847989 RepID=A0ABX8LRI5_9BACT|nr:DUF445 domain-containing protein [Geomonas subterranea]QXE92873.1 DUF445 domain-containing protein [Geomonas subterranea]QXM09022.1 DUF445 domain-containing protein [Geomonas subterranea]